MIGPKFRGYPRSAWVESALTEEIEILRSDRENASENIWEDFAKNI